MDTPRRKEDSKKSDSTLETAPPTRTKILTENLPTKSELNAEQTPDGTDGRGTSLAGYSATASDPAANNLSPKVQLKTIKAPHPDFEDGGSHSTLERVSKYGRKRPPYCSDDSDDDCDYDADGSSQSRFPKHGLRIHSGATPPGSKLRRMKAPYNRHQDKKTLTTKSSGYMANIEPIVVGSVQKMAVRSPSRVRRKMKRQHFAEAIATEFSGSESKISISSRKSLLQFETKILGEPTIVSRREEYEAYFTGQRFHRLKPTHLPRHVTIIYLAATVDRLSHIGVRSLMMAYYMNISQTADATASLRGAMHWFQLALTGTGLLMSVVSDGVLGTFRSLVAFSAVCVLATMLMLSSIYVTGSMAEILLNVGLLFFMLGMGGYRGAYSSLGATQYLLPEQAGALHTYYYFCHFWACTGIFIAKMGTPQLVHTFSCETGDCYAIGFFIIMMAHILVTFLLICFRNKFATYVPRMNLPIKVISCIFHAAQSRCSTTDSGEDWLEGVRSRFGGMVVRNARIVMELALVFLLSPVYWGVYYNATRLWHFYAQRSNGRISETVEVMPEQLMAMVSGFALVTTPLIYNVALPLLARAGIKQVPQRLVIGAFLCCLSYFFYFVMLLAVAHDDTTKAPGIGTCDVRFYNPTPCEFDIASPEISLSSFRLRSMQYRTFLAVNWDTDLRYDFTLRTRHCSEKYGRYPTNGTFELQHRQPNGVYFSTGLIRTTLDVYPTAYRFPKFRFLINCRDRRKEYFGVSRGENVLKVSVNSTEWYTRPPGLYKFDNKHNTRLEMGGIYNFLVAVTQKGTMKFKQCLIHPANHLHVFWVLPSIFLMSCAEVMFLVSCLELAYKHGPVGLKNMALNMFLVTNGLGNLFDVFMKAIGVIEERFASIMFTIVMLVAAFLMLVINSNFKFCHHYVASEEEFLRMAEGHEAGQEEEEEVLSLPSNESDRMVDQIIAHNQRLIAKRDDVRGQIMASKKW